MKITRSQKTLRFALLFMQWLFALSPLQAQNIHPSWRHFTVDDGLPSSECYEIIQDQQGYVWISTDNGVSRFDGHSFQNFGENEGLKNKTVLFMHEDHRGWIWMSTLSGNFYIHRGDTIAPYVHNDVLQGLGNEFRVMHDFFVDIHGGLHVSLINYGVLHIQTSGEFECWRTGKITGRTIFGAYEWDNKFLQLSEKSRITKLAKKEELAREEQENYAKYWLYRKDMITGNLDSFLLNTSVSSSSTTRNFYFFKPADQVFLQYRDSVAFFDDNFRVEQKIPFDIQEINSVMLSQSNTLFIGLMAGEGLVVFDNYAAFYEGKLPRKHFLLNKTVSHLMEDRYGGIWVATIEDGLYYIPDIDINMVSLPVEEDELAIIQPGKPAQLFVGTKSGDIYEFAGHSLVPRILKAPHCNELYGSMYDKSSEELFIGCHTSVWDGNTWQNVKAIQEVQGPRHDELKFVSFTNSNKIIAYSPSTLFQYMKPESGDRTPCFYELNKLPPVAYINEIAAYDENGPFWLATRSGLFRYDLEDESFELAHENEMLTGRFRSVRVLQDKSVVSATKNYGLIHLKDGEIQQVSETDGLTSNAIDKIRVDEKGVIWATSDKGLNQVTLQDTGSILHTYTTRNGLPSNEIKSVGFYDGETWILHKKEAVILPPDFQHKEHDLSIHFKRIMVNDEQISFDQMYDLSWDNIINIQFTAFNFSTYPSGAYRYRLAATDEWVETPQPEVTLIDLAPGSFEFEVQALQNDRKWSDSAKLSLSVAPPFWQRWWFRTLAVLGLVSLAYYFVNQRFQSLKISQERSEMEQEIDRLKQQAYRAQMNPHFVFNCLNAIQGFILGNHLEHEKAVYFLSKFSQLMRMALDFSREEEVFIAKEIDLLQHYLELEQMRFSHRFSFEIDLAPEVDANWTKIPPMLVQPYVENAVLHGMAEDVQNGKIKISFQRNENDLEVTIMDNGIGITEAKLRKAKRQKSNQVMRKSAGMGITQQRLELLNKNATSVRIENRTNGETGTKVTIHVPIDW